MRNLMLILAVMFIIPIYSCSSSRDVSERRSLMMPKTSDMPRNRSKFREIDYSKRNKQQTKRSNDHSRNYSYNRWL